LSVALRHCCTLKQQVADHTLVMAPAVAARAMYQDMAKRPIDVNGSPSGGKRHLRLGMTSTVDTIVYGRDLDQSGDNPHEDFMRKYGDHAGMKCGDKEHKPYRKPVVAQSSTMDTIIYGRDFDASGENPHEDYMKQYGNHAGKKSTTSVTKSYKPNSLAQRSMIDSVIYGRDLDNSGDDPYVDYMRRFAGFAGVKSEEKKLRQFSSATLGLSQYSDVAFNKNPAESGQHPHQAWMQEKTHGAAGLQVKCRGSAPCTSKGLTQVCSMNSLLHGIETSEPEDAIPFDDYAGFRSTVVHKPQHKPQHPPFTPPPRIQETDPSALSTPLQSQRRGSRVNPFGNSGSSESTCSPMSVMSSSSSAPSLGSRPRWR